MGLHADSGAWLPGAIPDPGAANVQLQLGEKPTARMPDKTINARDILQQPRGIALDAQGLIYVADAGHHRVAVLDQDGKLVRSIGKEGTGPGEFTSVEDVAIGPDNKLYVLELPGSRRGSMSSRSTASSTM